MRTQPKLAPIFDSLDSPLILFTSGILCSHILWVLRSSRGGCRELDGGSSSGRGGRSWEEGKLPTPLLLAQASTRCDGLSASPDAWGGANIISLSCPQRLRVPFDTLFPKAYLVRLSFLALSRLDRSWRQQMRKDRDMARMTMPLTTEANTATLRPRSSGLGIAVGRKSIVKYLVVTCKMLLTTN